MRIALSAGHNVYNNGIFDCGAIGNGKREADITNETVALLIPILKSQGHTVINVTPYNEKFKCKKDHHILRCKRADEFNADLYLDIHINAGGGSGVECWIYDKASKSYTYAEKICNSISTNIGLKNRGIKVSKDFYTLKLSKCPAMIIEGCFIDNVDDMKKLTPEKYAKSIAKTFEVEKSIAKSSSEYYEKYGLKIIETAPDNVYVAKLPGKTLRQFGIYGINGTWQNNSEAHMPRSIWGLAGNGNKAIGPNSYQNSPKGYKRGTIIYYEDGSIEVKRINNIKEIDKSFKWCIGGGMLIPDYNPTLEKIPDDILRTTSHTGMGYKGDRAYLFVHPKCSMYEFRNCVEKLNLDGAIFLDGGGSTQMNYAGGKGIHSSRKLSHGVFIKDV
ncbi:N-acetylmuramoyl-L-alanine amidase [Sporanaerobacter sp. PP17-6a]|uniref:N-acetylmuramoyl-L-alanine amidase n=1 Tax=Sporanaerobacter sp. PP17-6a TaxID=1891289 RepID=UPI00089FE0DC|nr:N-acetylmuramoyl-L-alanine amidase [Sporanaerobacter sp. PP17-6a]SCL85253.1 Sporulation-specific N-acetylmuramoyl-L-alanine amidase [Sporanaerobacter sp. PP17-6a]